MRFVQLKQRTDEWKRWRKEGITATDTPVIMGVSAFKTEYRLWCEKIGRMQEPDLSAIPAVRYGVENESRALSMFASQTNDILSTGCAEHDRYPIFRASFDGINSKGEPVEIKCPSKDVLSDVRQRGRDSDAYRMYVWQVMHQIFVAESRKGWLVFLDGNSLLIFGIDRDEAMIAKIKSKGLEFFERVITQQEPERDPQRDFYLPQTEEEVERWVESANAWNRLEACIAEHKAEIERLKSSQETFKKALLEQMGQFDAADYAGVAITRSYARGVVNLSKVLALMEQKGQKPSEAELNACRQPSSERILMRSTGRTLPRDSIESANVEAVLAIEAASNKPSLIW